MSARYPMLLSRFEFHGHVVRLVATTHCRNSLEKLAGRDAMGAETWVPVEVEDFRELAEDIPGLLAVAVRGSEGQP